MYKKIFAGIAILALVACSRTIEKRHSGSSSTLEETELVKPIEISLNNSKAALDTLSFHKQYSIECDVETGACNGLWVLSQKRCNDEVVTSGYLDQPVAFNFHGDLSETQYADGRIEAASFTTHSGMMNFKIDENKSVERSFKVALGEGVMHVYFSSPECTGGFAKMIYLRATSESKAKLMSDARNREEGKEETVVHSLLSTDDDDTDGL